MVQSASLLNTSPADSWTRLERATNGAGGASSMSRHNPHCRQEINSPYWSRSKTRSPLHLGHCFSQYIFILHNRAGDQPDLSVEILELPRLRFSWRSNDPLNGAVQQEFVGAVQTFMNDSVSWGADQPRIVRIAHPTISWLTAPLPIPGRLG